MTTAWSSGNQTNSRRREGAMQAADADAEKAREEDEVGEVGQQPDVGRHPANERDFEEENEKGGEENPRPTGIGKCHR